MRGVEDSYNPLLNGPLSSRDNFDDNDIADLLSADDGKSTLPPAVQEMLEEKTRQAMRAKKRSLRSASGGLGDEDIGESEGEAGPEIRITIQTHVDPEEARAANMSANAIAARQKRKVFPIRLVSVGGVGGNGDVGGVGGVRGSDMKAELCGGLAAKSTRSHLRRAV